MSDFSVSTAPTRRGNPETSFAAAAEVRTGRMQSLTLQALSRLCSERPGPFTQWEVEAEVEQQLGRRLADSTVRSRLPELVRKGLVLCADREGISPSGHACSRYRLSDVGMAV